MSTVTSSENLTILANQFFAGAADATNDADREALLGLARKYDEMAARRRTEEMAEEVERRAFWAARPLMNWVS